MCPRLPLYSAEQVKGMEGAFVRLVSWLHLLPPLKCQTQSLPLIKGEEENMFLFSTWAHEDEGDFELFVFCSSELRGL